MSLENTFGAYDYAGFYPEKFLGIDHAWYFSVQLSADEKNSQSRSCPNFPKWDQGLYLCHCNPDMGICDFSPTTLMWNTV